MPGQKRTNIYKIKNFTWTPNNIFDFLNVHPFSPGGFFTFWVVVALGVAHGMCKKDSNLLAPFVCFAELDYKHCATISVQTIQEGIKCTKTEK